MSFKTNVASYIATLWSLVDTVHVESIQMIMCATDTPKVGANSFLSFTIMPVQGSK